MSVILVVGMQWGDEAKGKIVDLLSEKADIVARFQGGPNAGHTVVIEDDEFVLHQIPSGILRGDKECVIGNGMIIDLRGLVEEMEQLRERGLQIEDNLVISEGAHLIMPYHRLLDGACEQLRGKRKIGTTKRGIGPTYADKVSYKGIRVCDLMDETVFARKLEFSLKEKNFLFRQFFRLKELEFKEIYEEFLNLRDKVRPYIRDTRALMREAVQEKKNILLEGAQGTMLDVDHGTYPYVTASNSSIGGVGAGLGIPPQKIDHVIGVAKAFTTRVGEGPLPTEERGKIGEILRDRGNEFGATTGRPRRCGYLDLVVLNHSCWLNGVDHLAITKLDVLDTLGKIRVCTHYEFEGEILHNVPVSTEIAERCRPVYEDLDGWSERTSGIKRYDELPDKAKEYLSFVSNGVGVPITIIGTGPGRSDAIVLESLFQK
nr:MAG: adenylosuccinate synthetase [Candidatus Thorarchaeota archaeon SMTZ1-83]